MSEVPDPVFAQLVLGDGFAVDPVEGVFVSPVAGELTLLAETLHAFGVRSEEGLEVLVHIGLDTVKLAGDGFTARRRAGDRVGAGDPVIEVDLTAVAGRVPSMITPVVITNRSGFTLGRLRPDAEYGAPVLTVSRD